MHPLFPWGPTVPTLTLYNADIRHLADTKVDLPFVYSALQLLFPKLKIEKFADNKAVCSLLQIPPYQRNVKQTLALYDAVSLTAPELRAMEASGASVAAYALRISGDTNAKGPFRNVELDLHVYTKLGTFQVSVTQQDSMLKRTVPLRFTTPRIHVAYHNHAGEMVEPQGIPWKKPEAPVKTPARKKLAEKTPANQGVNAVELV